MKRQENLKKIKELVSETIEVRQFLNQLSHFLEIKGVAKFLVDEVIAEFKKQCHEEKWLTLIQELLAKKIKTSGGFTLDKPKKIALVGPTGVGKTTCLLKLYDLLSQEKKVALATLDHDKGGASRQIEKYVKKAPLKQIDQLSHYDVALIDTAGCNYYEPQRVERVRDQLIDNEELEIHLVLSSTMKEVDLYGAIHQFSILPLTSVIMTKLDETLSSGSLVNLSAKIDLPISYIAYGYPLPGKIEAASASEIAHKILTELNEEPFQLLRQLACNNNN